MQLMSGEILAKLLRAAAEGLEADKERVNALNVFPVPDGDTGTNMALTLKAAADGAEGAKLSMVGEVARGASHGALLGARGNSGVMLSQFFQGFADGLDGLKTAGPTEFAHALELGSEAMYRAVSAPVEGTILTVSRGTALAAKARAVTGGTLLEVTRSALRGAREALDSTPQLLPVLQREGVVDAGGFGFLIAWRSAFVGLYQRETETRPWRYAVSKTSLLAIDSHDIPGMSEVSIENPYCTEYLIEGDAIALDTIRFELEALGDCVIVVGDTTLAKVHVHTDHPGRALEVGLRYGPISSISIDNMVLQYQQSMQKSDAASMSFDGVALVTVANGPGLVTLFESLGATQIVHGGQTLNPSTEDLAKACRETGAKEVIILPNNANIIASAEQVHRLVSCKVVVIPTRSIATGLSVMLAYDPEDTMESNQANMTERLNEVKSGAVTRASKTTEVDGIRIQEGDMIGIAEDNIVVAGDRATSTVVDLLHHLTGPDSEIISLFVGEGAIEEDIEEITSLLEEAFPDCDVDVHIGGQPVYDYLISVE